MNEPHYVPGTLEAVEIIKENPIAKRFSLSEDKKEVLLDGKPMKFRDENAIIQHFRENGVPRFWVIPYAMHIIAEENSKTP